MNTASIIFLSLFFALLLAVLFHPQRGILVRLRFRSAAGQRELVEDALKYLWNQEQSRRYASHEALAGALHLTGADVLRLMARMESQGLLDSRTGGLQLTPEGRRWALQVVRAHRLLERYLADEARLPLDQVHAEAERREHSLTPAPGGRTGCLAGVPGTGPARRSHPHPLGGV